MITLKFETKQFRVQINGKTAWIERSERGRWVFRGQHTIPVDGDGLRRRNGTIMLAAVVRHFAAHGGDQNLREALAGAHTEETEPTPVKPAQASIAATRSPKLGLPAFVSTTITQRFRQPLRPPLKA
jgi:hypothetical protein